MARRLSFVMMIMFFVVLLSKHLSAQSLNVSVSTSPASPTITQTTDIVINISVVDGTQLLPSNGYTATCSIQGYDSFSVPITNTGGYPTYKITDDTTTIEAPDDTGNYSGSCTVYATFSDGTKISNSGTFQLTVVPCNGTSQATVSTTDNNAPDTGYVTTTYKLTITPPSGVTMSATSVAGTTASLSLDGDPGIEDCDGNDNTTDTTSPTPIEGEPSNGNYSSVSFPWSFPQGSYDEEDPCCNNPSEYSTVEVGPTTYNLAIASATCQ
jgi:hypothetical protein